MQLPIVPSSDMRCAGYGVQYKRHMSKVHRSYHSIFQRRSHYGESFSNYNVRGVNPVEKEVGCFLPPSINGSYIFKGRTPINRHFVKYESMPIDKGIGYLYPGPTFSKSQILSVTLELDYRNNFLKTGGTI